MQSPNSTPFSQDQNFWAELRQKLTRYVGKLVRNGSLYAWRGQEEDVIADIVSEAIVQTYDRVEQANRGEAPVVLSIEAFSKTCAYHCFINAVRKDNRIIRLPQLNDTPWEVRLEENSIDYIGQVDNKLFNRGLFMCIVETLQNFPKKRQRAFLIDMARLAMADKMHPFLRQAFQEAGFHLADPQYHRPSDERERNKITSLTSLAYKQLAQLPSVQYYIAGL